MIGLCVCCPLVMFLVALQLAQLRSQDEIRCSSGEFLRGDTCMPCEPPTFMADDNHQHKNCISCNQPKPGTPEIVLEACTPTSDSKIGCSHGYYRVERGPPDQWACLKRKDCAPRQESDMQTCTISGDAICCPPADTASEVPNDDDEVCTAVTSQAEPGGEISIHCHRGHYLTITATGIPSCLPCREGTFMSDDLHSFHTCRKCTELEAGPNEILVHCSSMKDTILTCEKGHYRTQPASELDTTCLPCSICGPERPFERQSCGTHSDTVCCPAENMQVVKDAKGVYSCMPHPESTRTHTGVCPAGTYLDYNRGLANCVPCESGSFMPVGNHVNMNCKKCSEAQESLHEIEIATCTASTDTVIICQEGYFLNKQGNELAENSMEDRHDYDGCRRCTVCEEHATNKHVARNCSGDADTVCCPEADMTVALDDRWAVQCVASTSSPEVIIRCNKGYFLKLSHSGKPRCEDCPNGTFVDIDNHNFQDCKPCSKAQEFNMEVEVEQCTKTSDTLILCAEGHYRQESGHDSAEFSGECTPCRDCSYEPHNKYLGQKCHNYTDTICCPENNMDVEEFENGTYICTFPMDDNIRQGNMSVSVYKIDQKRNGSCISGEYPLFNIFNTSDVICRRCLVESNTTRNARVLTFCFSDFSSDIASPQSEKIPIAVPRAGTCRVGEYMYVHQSDPYTKGVILCARCEDGTFMSEDYHNRTECKPCSIKPGKTLIRNCTRTSDTKFTDTSNGVTPGNEHPLTTAIFFIIGAVISTVNGIRIVFHHLSRAIV